MNFSVLQELSGMIMPVQLTTKGQLSGNPKQTFDSLKGDQRYFQAFIGLKEGKWKDKESFAVSFGYEDSKEKGYKRLCLGLMERLVDHLPQEEAGQWEDTALNTCLERINRYWLAVDMLKKKGATEAFWKLADFTLKLAIRYEHLPVIVELLRLMMGTLSKRPEKYNDFSVLERQWEVYAEAYWAEMKIQMVYDKLMAQICMLKGRQEEKRQRIEQAYLAGQCCAGEYNFRSIQTYMQTIEMMYLESSGQWEAMIEKAEAAEAFWAEKNYETAGITHYFTLQKTMAQTVLNHRHNSCTVAEGLMLNCATGSVNWFKSLLVQCSSLMYASDYRRAWQCVQQALKHKDLIKIHPYDQEMFRLYEAFLILLYRAGEFQLSEVDCLSVAATFRIQKFLNSMPMHQQDKQGGNVSLQLLHALYLLQEGKDDAFESRMEALNKYKQRNLDPKNAHYRICCFIRMLGLIPALRCFPRQLEEKAMKILPKLGSSLASGIVADPALEAIPFESQWALAWRILYKPRQEKVHEYAFMQALERVRV